MKTGYQKKITFICCEKCGKKLIGRLPNGLFYFVFGKKRGSDGKFNKYCPVELYVHGSLKMQCLNRDCDHWNVLNYFPNNQSEAILKENSGKT